jgi:hypothetical protein
LALYTRAKTGVEGLWEWINDDWERQWKYKRDKHTYCCEAVQKFAISLLELSIAHKQMRVGDDGGFLSIHAEADAGGVADADVGAVADADVGGADPEDGEMPMDHDGENRAEQGEPVAQAAVGAEAVGDNAANAADVDVPEGQPEGQGDEAIDHGAPVPVAEGPDANADAVVVEVDDDSANGAGQEPQIEAEAGQEIVDEDKKKENDNVGQGGDETGAGGRPAGAKTVYPFDDPTLRRQMKERFKVIGDKWEDVLAEGERHLEEIGSSPSMVSLVIADPFYDSTRCYSSEYTLSELKVAGKLSAEYAVFIKWVRKFYTQ